MADHNRLHAVAGVLLAAVLILVVLATAALAQDETEIQDEQEVVQHNVAPAPAPKPGPDPGPFEKGRIRVGLYGGAGSTYNQTYVILGAGVGYYVLNGLEVGADVEGWLFQDPNIWKVTPQVRYVLWQISPIRPYVGAFWRQTYVDDPWSDYDSWGARGGIAYRKGGNYLAVGAVYEKFNDYTGPGDDYVIYPEIAFWVSF